MATQNRFVAAAQKWLRVGKKSLSVARSLDLAAGVMAVNTGLKPALLYDANSALADQIQSYLTSLQSEQLLSKSLITLDINGNNLIVNPSLTIDHLEKFTKRTVAVIDVRHSLDQPSIITDLREGDLEKMIQTLLTFLKDIRQVSEVKTPLFIGDLSETWNLCTLFGILLGYPVTYWFDQNESFENCLTMTPLVVTKALAIWQVSTESHQCCLYSFSSPEALEADTLSVLDDWTSRLQERFQQQTVFSGLNISKTTATLPSVTL
ncbi:UPF0739 protein C1orf74 homolog [Osmerus eperlanus]|uniref:UPF0739 protein C1orf74 homolog n=1 Tax=Osmerus eperlanus TaxID=29151 RepID=UPI002E1038A2